MRPWGAPAEARSSIAIDFEQDEEDGRRSERSKDVRRLEGHRQARLRRPDDHRPDPRRPGHGRADRLPTEGIFRSTASVHHFELSDLSRDEGALRDRLQASISGADRGTSHAQQEARPGPPRTETKGDKNPGRLKVAEQAVEQSTAASSRASSPSPNSIAIATRCPPRESVAPTPTPPLRNVEACSRRPVRVCSSWWPGRSRVGRRDAALPMGVTDRVDGEPRGGPCPGRAGCGTSRRPPTRTTMRRLAAALARRQHHAGRHRRAGPAHRLRAGLPDLAALHGRVVRGA